MDRFLDKVALVTGGSSGIGAEIARGLLAEGSHVVVVGRHHETFDRLQNSDRPLTGQIEFVAADVARSDDVSDVFAAIKTRHRRLDYAVNSAGIFDRSRSFHEYGDTEWDAIIDANVTGVFKCMRAELAMMIDNGGSIVNIASVVASRGSLRASPAYVAAKHAVLGLTRQAAVEYAARGIRVNAVSPGPTLTSMAQPLISEGVANTSEVVNALNPTARFVNAESVASTVMFLLSSHTEHINGAEIVIDDGQTARL